jgi:hypothetical protein
VHARDKYQGTVVGIKNVVVRAHSGFAILLWGRGDEDKTLVLSESDMVTQIIRVCDDGRARTAVEPCRSCAEAGVPSEDMLSSPGVWVRIEKARGKPKRLSKRASAATLEIRGPARMQLLVGVLPVTRLV